MEHTWFHGTSSESGLESGDIMDPSYGHFPDLDISVVWATSDESHARSFAVSTAALDDGDPVVWTLELTSGADVLTLSEFDAEAISEFAAEGGDAVIIEKGENGKPEMAILTRFAARVR